MKGNHPALAGGFLLYSFELRQVLRYEITLKENQILDCRVPRYVPFEA